MPNANTTEVYVLANQSAEQAFVRWYLTEEQAAGLFDSAVAAGGDDENVILFALRVPDITDQGDVRQRAEAAMAAGRYQAIRIHVAGESGLAPQ